MAVALLALMIARLQAAPARLRGRRLVQGALAVHAATLALRGAYGAAHAPPDMLQPFPGQLAVFASSMPVVVAATLGFLMMLHDRARRQLEHLARHDALTGLASTGAAGWSAWRASWPARSVWASRRACWCSLGPHYTQLLALTLLAPDLQRQILELEAVEGVQSLAERQLRRLVAAWLWPQQRAAWEAVAHRE